MKCNLKISKEIFKSMCANVSFQSRRSQGANDIFLENGIFGDDMGMNFVLDTRNMTKYKADVSVSEPTPKMVGTYTEDYNILHIDDIIVKKLKSEKLGALPSIREKLKNLEILRNRVTTHVIKEKNNKDINDLKLKIEEIESGRKLQEYQEKSKDLLDKYKRQSGSVRTIFFDVEGESDPHLDDAINYRLDIIAKYISLASNYIQIELVRKHNKLNDLCTGCSISLIDIVINEEGTRRCPECLTEHATVILTKMAKDGSRINTIATGDDESIDNFLRALLRYQGLQSDSPPESLYDELDDYFQRHGRATGDIIRQLPLNNRGRRGDTTHAMLWNALAQIKRSEYYEHVNLIGHRYWDWRLPEVVQYKDTIISHYEKTQQIYYQIPIEERRRISSLGTQFRLWRHLQLVGHECYMDEFKIAENPDSLRNHNKLWKIMCDRADDPEIYYIP